MCEYTVKFQDSFIVKPVPLDQSPSSQICVCAPLRNDSANLVCGTRLPVGGEKVVVVCAHTHTHNMTNAFLHAHVPNRMHPMLLNIRHKISSNKYENIPPICIYVYSIQSNTSHS